MKFKKISVLILAASLSLALFAGCSSKTTNGGNSTKKNVSSNTKKTNISQAKTKIKARLKELVSSKTINQAQSDKILTSFITNIKAYENGKKFDPLSSLVKDGTITDNQQTAVSESLRQFYPKGKETDSGKQELMEQKQ